MRYFVADRGNSRLKVAIYQGHNRLFYDAYSSFASCPLGELVERFGTIDAAIVSSSGEATEAFVAELKELLNGPVVDMDHTTPLPIKNLYGTPQTLGLDRLIVAAAAVEKFPQRDIIIFDLGTAMTIDNVTKDREFLGGGISPGLAMRFRALNHFTERLPLLSGSEIDSLYSNYSESRIPSSTSEALFYGVVRGIVNEIEGYLQQNCEKVPFFTGGDALFFEKLIKMSIFVDSEASLLGLRAILERICLDE